MKRFLLQIWRILPPWMERIASAIVRPRYRVVVGAIILNGQGQLLLCRHTNRRLRPWGMPGGDIKFGEDPSDAIRRELREETGFSVDAARLLLVEGSTEIRKVSLTYLCTGIRGPFLPNEEVSMVQYFDTTALPVISREERLTVEKALAVLKAELR